MDTQFKLIKLVKKHTFLYKREPYCTKGTIQKRDAWNNIGRKLNLPGPVCRFKWNNLRLWYKNIQTQGDPNKFQRLKKHLRFLDKLPSYSTQVEHNYTIKPSNVFRPTQKKIKLNSGFQSETVIKIINPIFEGNDSSVEPPQTIVTSVNTNHLRPVSSTLPPIFANFHKKIDNFLESAASEVTKLQKESKSSTAELFESLAQKITRSNLTQKQLIDIENCICKLVFTELEKFYLEKKSPKRS